MNDDFSRKAQIFPTPHI